MHEIEILGMALQLLPEKAIYVEQSRCLLVSDVHLGKSETFQALGVPISNQVNQGTLDRLQQLCAKFAPDRLIILGDLFHSRQALVDEVLLVWREFLQTTSAQVQLIVGNHDRALVPTLKRLAIDYSTTAIHLEQLVLSHEPCPQPGYLNICGHIHPCVRIKTRLDHLRLPCFYLNTAHNQLILPSFGEFTGGYDMALKRNAIAYVIVDDRVVPFGR